MGAYHALSISAFDDTHEKADGSPSAKFVMKVDKRAVDIAALFLQDFDGANNVELDAEEAEKLRRRIDWHLMPLMCILYLMTFADKTTLGQSAVLGIQQSAHLDQTQFNWLGTVFYIAYLAFQYPQGWALQHFPAANWMCANIVVWAIALLCHAACRSFGALLVVRIIMGVCEGAIAPGLLLVTGMFYTRAEQVKRVGYWCSMNGVAAVLLGLLGFGVLHIHTGSFEPWQWLTTVTGVLTLFVALAFWIYFPDSPTTAWFLTPAERAAAVRRIRANQTGMENKVWKREQFVETLTDPKTWLFALFAVVTQLLNSLTNQRQIIVNQFGFNVIDTTLIGCVDGVVQVLVLLTSVTVVSIWANGRVYVAALCFVPGILGSILVSALPFHNKGGLLVSYWLSICLFPPYTIFLSWVGLVTSGYTKRTTTNAIVLASVGLGNSIGPFMWRAQYQPRNRVPWGIFSGAGFASAVLLLLARWMLARENTRRDREQEADAWDEVYMEEIDADGKLRRRHVDRAFLDITDVQNKEFRYPL